MKNDQAVIMQSYLNGENVQPFFRKLESGCTCPYKPSVRPILTIDKTIQNPLMYWISEDGHLNLADIYGCLCTKLLNMDFSEATYLTVDKTNVYWFEKGKNKLYFIRKPYSWDENERSERNIFKRDLRSFYLHPKVHSFKVLGKTLQPYPVARCLIPRQIVYNVERLTETANSITVKLPEPVPDQSCEKHNLPSTLYTIYVSQCSQNDLSDNCERTYETTKVQTYEHLYEIRGLKPFTRYKLQLALSNYYVDLESMKLEFGSGVVLKTGPGKPSAPENMSIEVLTPTSAAVYWMPPKILNSAAVNYEVHWTSIRVVNGMRQKGEQLVKEPELANGRFRATLQSLLPGQEYMMCVRVYPKLFNEFFNESCKDLVQMYPEPSNLTLSGSSVNSMNISWILNVKPIPTIKYVLEYKDVAMESWQTADNFQIERNKVTYYVEGLQPRTLYKFRLLLRYSLNEEDFIWPPDGGFTFQTLGKYISYFCYTYTYIYYY